jgi:hypothetical protein
MASSTTKLDSAIKFGAGRYRQESGLLDHIGEEVRRFGRRVLVVAGPRAWNAVKDKFTASMNASGVDFQLEIFGGWCSFEEAKVLAERPYLCLYLCAFYLHERYVHARGRQEA